MDSKVIDAKLSRNAGGPRRAGEAVIRSIEIACKRLSAQALKVLEKALADEGVEMRYRIEAAKEILNRGWGRSRQSMEVTLNDESGSALIDALKTARERAGLVLASTPQESVESITQH